MSNKMISATLDTDVIAKVKSMAKKNDRSFSKMLSILLKKGIESMNVPSVKRN